MVLISFKSCDLFLFVCPLFHVDAFEEVAGTINRNNLYFSPAPFDTFWPSMQQDSNLPWNVLQTQWN
ncbi:hypothetical protein SLEP1_g30200 [Rubroshorea leprosula]|uniref:Uncharacterized protein n=1 Tax=Rubroshorea leprosula TaxID=152421 RepID=A0AAV5K9Y5_9ROSI|nr:hypothetical protein SLEP1_g30200 [Rubroshorea leprosula]